MANPEDEPRIPRPASRSYYVPVKGEDGEDWHFVMSRERGCFEMELRPGPAPTEAEVLEFAPNRTLIECDAAKSKC